MADTWYYDFMNPNTALAKALTKQGMIFGIRYLKDIVSTKVSMFRYDGVEKIKNLTSEILETIMCFNCMLCFYDVGGEVTLCRYVPTGVFDRYHRPTKVNLFVFNGECVATEVNWNDIVLVRDNSCDIIPFLCMCEYIQMIQRIDDTIFKVLNNISLPLVIAGSKKATNELKIIAKKLGSNDPYIVGDDSLVEQVKAFNIDTKVNPSDIYLLKTKYKNELLASMGIYSVEEKRERKIVSEVASQNDYTDTIYQDMKQQRERMISQLKEKFGIEITLEESYKKIVDQAAEEVRKMAEAQSVGGDNNDVGTENDVA